ncbi:MAG: ferric reductase-like transmembrane domain-containing protein [Ilumatobacteraceae bacterium]
MINPQFWWYLTRASGIVAWGFLTASALWGILLSTRLLKPYDRPAWLLDLHRWLGALTILGVGLHIVAIVADSFVHFGVADVLMPLAASWKPLAVAWGIIAMYLLVAVQLSSLLMKKIPKRLWRGIHLTSYALFASVSIHSFTAGTDRGVALFQALGVALITLMLAFTAVRLLYNGKPRNREVLSKVRQALPPPEAPLHH